MIFDTILIKKAKELLHIALDNHIKISCAESCTGGLISSLITEIDGSSQIFDRGFVTYSNLAKIENLNVNPKTLEKFGAVSQETSREMAIGAVKNSQANLSIATTGIAGPKSNDTKKPVGLVFISSFNKIHDKLITEKFNFTGNRAENRIETTIKAIDMLINQITNI